MSLHLPTMKEERVHSKEQARVFHQLLRAIEVVRITRQEQYHERRHPQSKHFTQQELNDEACPTYKNWLIGRSHRLPSRTMLMRLHQHSTIHFFFNPDFCRRSTISPEARALWQQHTLSGIQLFKQQNVLSQYETWYQQSVQQWCEIPGFQAYWEKARKETRQEIAPTKMILARMATTGEVIPIHLRHMLVSISGKISPAVSAFLPVDEAARAVFASFGSETSWPSSVD